MLGDQNAAAGGATGARCCRSSSSWRRLSSRPSWREIELQLTLGAGDRAGGRQELGADAGDGRSREMQWIKSAGRRELLAGGSSKAMSPRPWDAGARRILAGRGTCQGISWPTGGSWPAGKSSRLPGGGGLVGSVSIWCKEVSCTF